MMQEMLDLVRQFKREAKPYPVAVYASGATLDLIRMKASRVGMGGSTAIGSVMGIPVHRRDAMLFGHYFVEMSDGTLTHYSPEGEEEKVGTL